MDRFVLESIRSSLVAELEQRKKGTKFNGYDMPSLLDVVAAFEIIDSTEIFEINQILAVNSNLIFKVRGTSL